MIWLSWASALSLGLVWYAWLLRQHRLLKQRQLVKQRVHVQQRQRKQV